MTTSGSSGLSVKNFQILGCVGGLAADTPQNLAYFMSKLEAPNFLFIKTATSPSVKSRLV